MENDDLGSITPDSGDMDILNEGTNDDAPLEEPKKEKEDETPFTEDITVEEGNDEIEEGTEEDKPTEDETPKEDREAESANPSFTKIREAYPDFFKKFPEVKIALGRELEYKKLYPTIDEAKESKERLDFHTELEESILGGHSGLLLSNLHKTDEKALEKFSLGFLPTLMKGNPPLYEKVALPIIKNVLISAEREAKKTNSKDLAMAVRWVSAYVFENEDGSIPADEKVKNNNDEPSESEQELRKVLIQKLSDFKGELQETTQNILEAHVKSTLDPTKKIPGVLREALLNKILLNVKQQLGLDESHTAHMTRLWQEARKSNYSRQSLNQLKSAYLVGAKKILPVIQKKEVEATMKELGHKVPTPPDNKTRKIGPTKEKTKFAAGFVKDPKKLDPSKSDAELLGD